MLKRLSRNESPSVRFVLERFRHHGAFARSSATAAGHRESGFTLLEVLVSVSLTLIVMGAVFGLLTLSQRSFRREPEVSALQQNARSGLEVIGRDLLQAGYKTPAAAAVLTRDGARGASDGITILYAEPNDTVAQALRCDWLAPSIDATACPHLDRSSILELDVSTMDPRPIDPTTMYSRDAVLLAIEQDDCNNDDLVGIVALEVTGEPTLILSGETTGLQIPVASSSLMSRELALGEGFNTEVRSDCAVVGRFRAVQYRLHEPPSSLQPTLERRDVAASEAWIPVAFEIEDLQFQYLTNENDEPVDSPLPPHGDVPDTWITGVRMRLVARSASSGLEGATLGAGPSDDVRLRRGFSTSVSLRNVAARVASTSLALTVSTW